MFNTFSLFAALFTIALAAPAQAIIRCQLSRTKFFDIHFTDKLDKTAEHGFIIDKNGRVTDLYYSDPRANSEDDRCKTFPIASVDKLQTLQEKFGYVGAQIKYTGSTLTLRYSENARRESLTTLIDPLNQKLTHSLSFTIVCNSDNSKCSASQVGSTQHVGIVTIEPTMADFVICSKAVGIKGIYVQ